MREKHAKALIEQVRAGKLDLETFIKRLKTKPSSSRNSNSQTLPKQDKEATMTPSIRLEEDCHGRWRVSHSGDGGYWIHDFDTAVHVALNVFKHNKEQIIVRCYNA